MKTAGRAVLTLSPFVIGGSPVSAAPPATMPPKLPSLREQEAIRQEWLKLRLERVLPTLMRRHGVSMWLVINREYNEDPVFRSLISPSGRSGFTRSPTTSPCCASLDGFTLHAATRAGGLDAEGREALLRYVLSWGAAKCSAPQTPALRRE